MPDVLIRDLDEAVHIELKRRARARGQSMQAYLRDVLAEHAESPTIEQWLDRLAEIEPIDDASGPEALARAREDLP